MFPKLVQPWYCNPYLEHTHWHVAFCSLSSSSKYLCFSQSLCSLVSNVLIFGWLSSYFVSLNHTQWRVVKDLVVGKGDRPVTPGMAAPLEPNAAPESKIVKVGHKSTLLNQDSGVQSLGHHRNQSPPGLRKSSLQMLSKEGVEGQTNPPKGSKLGVGCGVGIDIEFPDLKPSCLTNNKQTLKLRFLRGKWIETIAQT